MCLMPIERNVAVAVAIMLCCSTSVVADELLVSLGGGPQIGSDATESSVTWWSRRSGNVVA